jgi:hypothetical protein
MQGNLSSEAGVLVVVEVEIDQRQILPSDLSVVDR